MQRLFVALRPPPPIRDRLTDLMEGVPESRWQDDDHLHLTLRFVGAVDGAQAADIAAALAQLAAAAPVVALAGVGSFATAGAVTTLWAGLSPQAPLAALHAKVDRALGAAGVAPDRRAYAPHITLARLSRSAGRHPAVLAWLATHMRLTSTRFVLDQLILYESRLTRAGALYTPLARWPLSRR